MADTLMEDVQEQLKLNELEADPVFDEHPKTAEPELVNEVPADATRVIKYPVADAAIDELAEKYLPLTIKGVDDKEGFEACDAARKDVKKIRSTVEATRKELKADALEYGRKVDAEAKRLKGLLEPIENHLTNQVDAIKAEKKRIEREWLDKRIEALKPFAEVIPDESFLKKLDDSEFATLLANEQTAHEAREAQKKREEEERAELERLRAEEAKRQQEEAERLRAERAELERQKAELAEQQRQLEAAKADTEPQPETPVVAEPVGQTDREKLAGVARQLLLIEIPDVGPEMVQTRDEIIDAIDGLSSWIRKRTIGE
jgi:DNA repair exonuclease SbcCD ATPase subunit